MLLHVPFCFVCAPGIAYVRVSAKEVSVKRIAIIHDITKHSVSGLRLLASVVCSSLTTQRDLQARTRYHTHVMDRGGVLFTDARKPLSRTMVI